jgi:hypothetical protein
MYGCLLRFTAPRPRYTSCNTEYILGFKALIYVRYEHKAAVSIGQSLDNLRAPDLEGAYKFVL